jgi:hypothetical protein
MVRAHGISRRLTLNYEHEIDGLGFLMAASDDWEEEGVTLQSVAKRIANAYTQANLNRVVEDLKQLSNNITESWETVMHCANYHFDSPSQARDWLNTLVAAIENERAKRGAAG